MIRFGETTTLPFLAYIGVYTLSVIDFEIEAMVLGLNVASGEGAANGAGAGGGVQTTGSVVLVAGLVVLTFYLLH